MSTEPFHFDQMSIKAIEHWLEQAEQEEKHSAIAQLQMDKRAGVALLLKRHHKEQEKLQEQQLMWQRMNEIETHLRLEGFRFICGFDEVGRGPLAGPVVAAAVILPDDVHLLGLNDSKQIAVKQREQLAERIKSEAVAVSIAAIDAPEIDRINIYEATKKAMVNAYENLADIVDYALIDAMQLPLPIKQQSLIKGDTRSVSIAAASVVAKVYRDNLMRQIAVTYPDYGFERHVGYGTPQHLRAIEDHGLTPIHRKSFLSRYIK